LDTLTAVGGTTYSWSSGEATNPITVSPASDASYTVTGTTNGCSNTAVAAVQVNPVPIITVNSGTICAGLSDTLIAAGGTTYSWSNGEAINPIIVSPTNTATYTVTGYSLGCAGNAIATVTINQLPVSNAGAIVSFCSGDSAAIGAPTTIGYTYLWSPTNGLNSATVSDPKIILANTSTGIDTINYSVITTNNGCYSADTVAVTVFPIPVSGFVSPAGQCFKGNNFSFNAGGSFLPNPNFLWSFGTNASPSASSLQNPSGIIFSTVGHQTVTLKITQHGCVSNIYIDSLSLFSGPIANFSFANVCLHQAMNFNNLSFAPGDTVSGWVWDFGNGTPSVITENPVYTYTNSGTFPVTLIATTNKGCKDTAQLYAKVHPLPDAKFSAANVCSGTSVQFSNLSSIPSSDTIQSWTWNFGDASPVNHNSTTSHLFTNVGSHATQLLATSNFGCRDSITKNIIIHPNPIVKFSAKDTIGCAPRCLVFQDSSSFLNGFNVQLAWNIGDGSPLSHQQNFEHCYTNSSVDSNAYFAVTLTVTSDSGCVSTQSKNKYITLYPHPNADFSVQPQSTLITEPVISTTNLTTGATLWNWDFGDLTISSLQHPAPHNYNDTGTYVITLITSTQHGCIDTVRQTITIEPDFVFYIPNAFSPDDDGINDTFTGKGVFINQYEMTIFDRWGNLIFFSDDILKPWDGMANHGSEIAQRDVYIYSIKVTDFKNKKYSYKGDVTLVR
jgi:gliding motility-associated-like protein